MKKLSITFILVFLSISYIPAQEISTKSSSLWSHSLLVEGGFIYPVGSIRESIAIRQNVGSYYVYQSSQGHISSESQAFITGLRWDLYHSGWKVGLSSGLRYIGYNSVISGYVSGNADFFYLRYSGLGSETKFARVNSITEENSFISIPLELMYIPFQYNNFGFFAKVGGEFSAFRLRHKTEMNLQNPEMDSHKDVILSDFTSPSEKFYSTLYGSFGIKYAQVNKPSFLFEVFVPSAYLTKDLFTLMEVEAYTGFRFTVMFPVKRMNN